MGLIISPTRKDYFPKIIPKLTGGPEWDYQSGNFSNPENYSKGKDGIPFLNPPKTGGNLGFFNPFKKEFRERQFPNFYQGKEGGI